MASSRTTMRAFRALRTRPMAQPLAFRARPAGRRMYADVAPAGGQSGASAALFGGMAGGALVFAIAYGWYKTSGVSTAVNSISTTKKYIDGSVKKMQDSVPEPSEALQWLRSTVLSYSAAIPGAKSYVNTAFDDLDAIHEKHGEEVDKIVKDMYTEIKDATKKGGMSLETAYKVWSILGEKMSQISALAGDAADQILDNHPQLKKQLGGSLDQLKSMGDSLGPDAKKQIDETWDQIKKIAAGGLGLSTIPQIKKLVEEKTEQLKKMGDEAWKKGLEQAKPLLEKSPEVKKLVEENADALKKGNYSEIWDKVKQAVESGKKEDLEKYVKQISEKAKDTADSYGFDMNKIMGMVPGGSEIGQKWEQLSSFAEKHGKEAEELLESTVKEVKDLLTKKAQDAQKLADKAKKDAKSS